MTIIGIGGWDHDANAAIVQGAELVAIGEEERFSREKYQGRRYTDSLEFCLQQGVNHVDQIAIGFLSPQIVERISSALRLNEFLKRVPIVPVEHHSSHCAAAFYGSGFDDALVVTLDGYGDGVCSSASLATKTGIERIWDVPYPHSLGGLWMSTSQLLGFGMRDAGKIMGLAAYGEPRYQDLILDAIQFHSDGRYEFKLDRHKPESFLHSEHSLFKQAMRNVRPAGEPIEQIHMDVAASLQSATEVVGLHIVKRLHASHSSKNLCLSGGVALNSSLNGVIANQSPFERVYVPPNPGDSGTGTGSALHAANQMGASPTISGPYLGVEYQQELIEQTLKAAGVASDSKGDIERRVALLLEQGKIVGWFQGRAEVGPRALGNRSILADPRNADMKDRLNLRVKFREWFRPFAPSVLESHIEEWFDFAKPSPYMSYVADVLSARRASVPAITHIDGTARLQTVGYAQNTKFYNLIEEFRILTGIPMVLNTSFNTMGEPIVNSPTDALRCFLNTGMDALAIGNALVVK